MIIIDRIDFRFGIFDFGFRMLPTDESLGLQSLGLQSVVSSPTISDWGLEMVDCLPSVSWGVRLNPRLGSALNPQSRSQIGLVTSQTSPFGRHQ
ncbi:MAG: hypothetical protein EAZ78_25245 [Oscillatoriales cyanobacterium]|nr:MAG: hypothetical protein EA000_08235 [Oscillatoriales cyanobacterium]TAD97451.1 MAG: hypothetical protein EAZ96_25060 [Oscillatoriales cyanobacterium]TAE01470.1 MAG: hypothetical protein EAZ98_03260 [Oscillatoriales cyanobacterium]TAE97865.1 MAG: hypothetical protein EAZ78_25245 [Oscillatoriales cyanobacterium]TAF37578.1 MAG: hypothetical protein EAZ68_14465 [Oscillatoriales cyanobacterium]